MVITTHNMEVKQLVESTHCVISGYDHAMDIGLFSAVVKADKHQDIDTDKSAKQRLKDLNKRPMSLRKEVYRQLEDVVDTNSNVDLNDYSLLDKWSMIHQKTVIVYTFDHTMEYFKVEYKTPNVFLPFIEILKTSIDDIVIAYNAILDNDILLKICAPGL